jgi:opacity protein-like surface antigen
MMNKCIVLAFVCLASCSLAVSASARDGFYIEGNVGPSILEDSDISGGGLSGEAEFDTGYVIGGAVGYRLADGFRVEGSVSYRESDVDAVTSGGVELNGAGDANLTAIMANAYYDFDLGIPVKPYLGVGIGVGIIEVNSDDSANVLKVDDDSAEFAWNIMLGAGYAVTEDVDLSFGYRYLGTTDPEFDATLLGVNGTLDAEITVHEVLFGLRYNF